MRKIINLTEINSEIVRLMIYNDENGTYLFGYDKLEDSDAVFDQWYESENEALEVCLVEYKIDKTLWIEIPNPMENCQHDWINPVRIKGRENGNPQFGKLEKWIDGKWIDID